MIILEMVSQRPERRDNLMIMPCPGAQRCRSLVCQVSWVHAYECGGSLLGGCVLVLGSCVSALVLGLIRLEEVAVAAATALGDATFAATLFC